MHIRMLVIFQTQSNIGFLCVFPTWSHTQGVQISIDPGVQGNLTISATQNIFFQLVS